MCVIAIRLSFFKIDALILLSKDWSKEEKTVQVIIQWARAQTLKRKLKGKVFS